MPVTTGMKGAGYYDQHSVPAGSRTSRRAGNNR